MATPKKISELPVAGALTGAEVFPIVQNSGTVQVAVSALAAYIDGLDDITNYIQFDTSASVATAVGRLTWDTTHGTLNLGLAGGNADLLLGQREVVYCYNNSGSSLQKGAVVRVTGSQGQRLTIDLAQANNDANSATVLGVLLETIANGASGFVATDGVVNNVNTSGFSDGQIVYLSPTSAGQLTVTKPRAPQHLVQIGYIVKGGSGGAGSIYVKVQNGYEIEELHDVQVSASTSIANGEVLVYDTSLGVWRNTNSLVNLTEVGIGTSSPVAVLNVVANTSSDAVRITQTGAGNALEASGNVRIDTGNLSFIGTGRRLTADMSNATTSSRFAIQTNVANSNTALHVIPNGTGVVSNLLLFNNSDPTNAAFAQIGAANSGTEVRVASGITGSGTYLPLTISTGGTERMRIDTSGNVGIGTSSPGGYKLHVDGAGITSAFGPNYNGGVAYNTGNTELQVNSWSGTPKLYIGRHNINSFDLSVDSGGASVFAQAGTERMRIDNSGNVGIGTSSLVNKLQVNGSFGRGAPVTKTGNFTLADTENWIICNGTATITVTLPAASSWTGREVMMKNIAAFTVVSNASNVVPLAGGAAGTAIMPATAGSAVTLVSDGTNWIIMR